MTAVLDVRGLTVAYGPRCTACADGPPAERTVCARCGTVFGCVSVDLDLQAGQALGIVGESGSGKSTVIGALALQTPVTEGSILLDGESVAGARGGRRRRLCAEAIALVRQRAEDGLALDVSAGGNVAGRLIAGGERRFETLRERSQQMHAEVELAADRLDSAVGTYSGGMRQRVQLARAVVRRPTVLLLDEPTTGLDVSVQARILDLVRRLRREHGLSLVVVSHDLAVIRMLAERVLVMRHGRVVERGLCDQVLSDPHHPYSQLLVSAQLT